MSESLILVGGGGHADAVIDVVERTGRWSIVGVIDPRLPPGTYVAGYPVIGGDEVLPGCREIAQYALVTVGQIRSSAVREAIYRKIVECGFTLPVVISPSAEVSRRAVIGAGTVAMHFAAVGPEAQVGINTILNSRSLVEHGVLIGNHCHIATGALLNGHVVIGDGSFVGSGCVVKEGVRVGTGCLIGMGCCLRNDLADGELFVGGRA